MSKVWLIARTAYRWRLRSGTFLILTLAMPALMVVVGVVTFLLLRGNSSGNTIGYVDQTGRLAAVSPVSLEHTTITFTAYTDRPAAQAALGRGDIAGYLVVPPGYFAGQAVTFIAKQEPGAELSAALTTFMRRGLLPGAAPWLLERLAEPAEVTYVARDNGLVVVEGAALAIRVAVPAILALVFALLVFSGATQMGSAIVREKEQRSLEMVITSLAPWQLVAGNVLGMTLLSLTQAAIWLGSGGAAASLALAGLVDLRSVALPWAALGWAVLLGLPGYLLYAVLAVGLGIMAGDSRQAQQLASLLGIIGLAPMWLVGLLVQSPNHPIAVGLTLFPLTGPMVSLLRLAFTEVPAWQLAASLILLVASLAASVWAVARIFRAAMLLYGQALRPGQILQALRDA